MNKSKVMGSILGLAACDALGTTIEFSTPGTFVPMVDIVGGGPFGLKAGEWTDDTSMALCLGESIVETNGFSLEDQMRRYVKWWKEGHLSSNGVCFDIGNTTRLALLRFQSHGDEMAGLSNLNGKGNGSIMRLAPVVLAYSNNAEMAVHLAGESSLTTHGAEVCYDACRYMALVILEALKGTPKHEIFDNAAGSHILIEKPLCHEIQKVADGSFKTQNPPEIQGSGYVTKSLEAALWAFWNGNDFKSGALLAVNLGDDADTTGAVYGQIAGAYYGVEGIPTNWINILARRPLLEEIATRIYNFGLLVSKS